ncbi:MAG: AI-2E family transporter [Bacteroides sp.]|nr:AI-2E family transporter [Bacteroides sp.]MCM1549769.1 AI-2E family transporter [Clostridium sp.]
MERKELERIILKTIIYLIIAVLIILHFDFAISILMSLIGFMSPILLGFAIAFVINIILVRLEKVYFPNAKNKFLMKSRRPVCIVLSLLIILAAIAFVMIMVIPELIDAFTLLAHEISDSYESILDKTAELISQIPPLESWLHATFEIDLKHPADINWEDFFVKLVAMIFGTDGSGKFGSIMDSTVSIASSIGSSMVRFFFALIFGIYALASKEKLNRQVKQLVYAYLKPKTADRIYHICGVANATFSNFIVGQCTEAVILGILCIIGMSIFRFPYAVMIGTLVGATALIPVIGAYLGAIIGAVMVLTQGSLLQAFLFLVFIVVLQQLEGNIIYPKVVGSSVGLPGIWVLAAVTIGASLNGVFGMLIGVPLAATLYRLLGEDSRKRLEKRAMRNQNIPDILSKLSTVQTENEPDSQADAASDSQRDTVAENSEKQDDNNHIDTINDVFDEIVVALHKDDEDKD